MKISIGTNIKRLRIAKGITQEQLSVAMNVTCAAVSKWERGETYPDITMLQPLAYFFGVTLDELMGYGHEKIQAEIEAIKEEYRRHWHESKGREIIAKAYREYPNDYWIMFYYMWNVAGDLADNDPTVLLENKGELLEICDKILEGCDEDGLRLGAWNMRAKILHAEGKTDEAIEIYRTKFADWYSTGAQKVEQLFSKGTDEYYFHVRKNMYELADFAADKLGRKIFFDPSLSQEEKASRALECGTLLIKSFEKTGEAFFLMLAKSLLGRMENDLLYRGGSEDNVIAVMEKHLNALQLLDALRGEDNSLDASFARYGEEIRGNTFRYHLALRKNATSGRRAELLSNPAYKTILEKYSV